MCVVDGVGWNVFEDVVCSRDFNLYSITLPPLERVLEISTVIYEISDLSIHQKQKPKRIRVHQCMNDTHQDPFKQVCMLYYFSHTIHESNNSIK